MSSVALPSNHLVYVTIFCFSFTQGIAVTLEKRESPTLASALAALPLLALLAAHLVLKRSGSADVLFGLSTLLVMAGIFLVPSSYASGYGAQGTLLLGANAFLEAGGGCFNLLLIVLTGSIAARNMLAAVSTAALVIGLSWFGVECGAIVGRRAALRRSTAGRAPLPDDGRAPPPSGAPADQVATRWTIRSPRRPSP